MTISGDVGNKLSVNIGTALEQVCCQRTHMFGEHIFFSDIEKFYKSWDLHSLLVLVCPLTT